MSAPGERRRAPQALRWTGHVRAASVFLLLAIALTGLAYPWVMTTVARAIDPSAAGGSLLRCSDGTVVGSAGIAQNLSAGALGPGLFWARPSATDYNLTLGAATPPGPSDPELRALLNQTIAWMNAENATGNSSPYATLPFWWVAASGSSVDPDLTPQATLVQIPRISANTSVSVASLMALVDAHIVRPPIPYVGVPYVNVLELDIALRQSLGHC